MFRNDKKGKTTSIRPLSELTPTVTLGEMLKDSKRQQLIDRIAELSDLEASRFESLCNLLLQHLVNHYQLLPDPSNSYYALPGGLIDYALNRTEAALSLFREYILQEETEITEDQRLWIYALLSAGLLQGIGKLQIDYKVDLYDINGQFLKPWMPLLESINAVGHYYYYELEKEGDIDFRRRLNILLARLLMPVSGFTWIASNQEVLMVWLALLNEDLRSAGTLGAILIRADAIAIQRYFNEHLIKGIHSGKARTGRISTFVDGNPDSLIDKERLVGIEFIKWINEKLANGSLMINKPPLFSVPGGLLMSTEIFKLFIREHPEFKNWQAAQTGFLALNLHRTNSDGSVISRFEQTNENKIESGIVFKDYALALPEQVQVRQLNNNAVKQMSATEVIYANQFNQNYFRQEQPTFQGLEKLTPAGKWQQVTSEVIKDNIFKPGTGPNK